MSILTRVADTLGPALGNVTNLHIRLHSRPPYTFSSKDCPRPPPGLVAASAVKCLAPHCAPLTHLTISGCLVQVRGTFRVVFDVLALLEDAKLTSAASLTRLHILLRREVHHHTWGVYQEPMFSQLLEPASEILSAFTRLTHLHLPGCSLDAQQGIDSLPLLLESLHLRKASYSPSLVTCLPNLRELDLEKSTCGVMVQLLRAAPGLQRVSLSKLLAPGSTAGLQDLHTLHAHPQMGLDGGYSTCNGSFARNHSKWMNYTPSGSCGVGHGGVHEGTGSGGGSSSGCGGSSSGSRGFEESPWSPAGVTSYVHNEKCQEREFAPWEVLERLPVLATITECEVDFEPNVEGIRPLWAGQQASCLHHIPRAFPNLTTLKLEYLTLSSPEFLSLLSCASLSQLSLFYCERLCGTEVIRLAQGLQKLEGLYVRGCDHVNEGAMCYAQEVISIRQEASALVLEGSCADLAYQN